MSEQQSQVVQAETSSADERPKWGEMPPPERIAVLEALMQAWEQMSAEARNAGRSPFDPGGPQGWLVGGLTGADVFFLVARTVAGTAEPSAIEAAVVRLLTPPMERPSFNLSALHLEGAYLDGAHLEGAILEQVHLEGANLYYAHMDGAGLQFAHLERVNLTFAHLDSANLSGAHLEGASLREAHLAGASLREAQVERADLYLANLKRASLVGASLDGANFTFAQLAGASLGEAHLAGADLRGASFDKTSRLNDAMLTGASFDQVTFDNTNLTVVDWSRVDILGDERTARERKRSDDKPKTREQRLTDYKAAVRANRVISVALRSQGLNEDADRFAYRAQVLQRRVLRLRRRYGAALGSWFLDLISGHGYKPMRSLIAYVLIICAFAGAYLFNAQFAAPHLTWDEALVLSISSFHGRGFFTSGISLGDALARLAAGEAIVGLLIEITFIATFTQRFFAR